MEDKSEKLVNSSNQFPNKEELKRLAEEQLVQSYNVKEKDPEYQIKLVAGVDVFYIDNVAFSAAVVVDQNLKLTEFSTAQIEVTFPYVSGYLSYREAKPAIEALQKIHKYDVLLVNGHGLAHPRRYGLASQIGIDLEKPTIGVATRLMVGQLLHPQEKESPVIYKGKIVGVKITSPHGASVFVSVGHMITLNTSIKIVKDYTIEGRLPEPLKIAHTLSKSLVSKTRNLD